MRGLVPGRAGAFLVPVVDAADEGADQLHAGIGAGLPGTQSDTGSWTGSATLSSSANDFNGSFSFDGTTDYSGTWKGRFFGPAAEQIGLITERQSTP